MTPKKSIFLSRIKRASRLLSQSDSAEALLASSAPLQVCSRDSHYPFRQNSDLFYFTGSLHQDLHLVLRPASKDPVVLVAPPHDRVKALWEGESPKPSRLASELRAKLILSKNPLDTVRDLLKGIHTAYLPSNPGSLGVALRQELATRHSISLRGLPFRIIEAEYLTSRLRAFKDSFEVRAIKEAASVTSATLLHVAQFIRSGVREAELAALIDYLYRLHGGSSAFGTIVATGPSASILHYHELKRSLRNGELLLIDTGCQLNMYSSDISRTIPVGGRPSPVITVLYESVLRAQEAAIGCIKPGVMIAKVYTAAAEELTRGLKELGVLKGSVSELVKKGAFKPWFPHGIGHSLGIDVHDVTPDEPKARLDILQPGMVITIEPGLYFNKGTGGIPACGVRIEDDVLVTEKGYSILSEGGFPKELDQVLELVGG